LIRIKIKKLNVIDLKAIFMPYSITGLFFTAYFLVYLWISQYYKKAYILDLVIIADS